MTILQFCSSGFWPIIILLSGWPVLKERKKKKQRIVPLVAEHCIHVAWVNGIETSRTHERLCKYVCIYLPGSRQWMPSHFLFAVGQLFNEGICQIHRMNSYCQYSELSYKKNNVTFFVCHLYLVHEGWHAKQFIFTCEKKQCNSHLLSPVSWR